MASLAVSPMLSVSPAVSITIVVPVFRDWDSIQILILELDRTFADTVHSVRLLLVNDSQDDLEHPFRKDLGLKSIQSVLLLNLCRNLGHQRAICIGLAYVNQHIQTDYIIVMDGDGEDRPMDVATLLANRSPKCVVFASRQKRSERISFRIGYQCYRRLHRILTGTPVRVGNFSILPSAFLRAIAASPESWNHFAAAIFKLRLPLKFVPLDRGTRYAGKSQMNLTGLIIHGLSAISVFAEQVSVRVLIANAVLLAGSGALLSIVLLLKLCSNLPIPGWTTYTFLSGIIVALQLLSISGFATLLVTFQRSNFGFLPARDYALFVRSLEKLAPANA